MVKKTSKNSPLLLNCVKAFLIGGAICLLGQFFLFCFQLLGLDQETSKMLLPVLMIFLGAFFTALHIYDKLAKHAGAGSIVPITGFANSIVSPAMEFKSEGFILGMGAKMFALAGPVLVFGTIASVIYGLILWIISIC